MDPVADPEVAATLSKLQDGQRTRLVDLATSGAPRTPGIYALWHADELLYVGIAKQDPALTQNAQAAGVRGRLGTYVRGRLTSDFVAAALLRFVVPHLTTAQLQALSDGTIGAREVQTLIKSWIGEHVWFSTCAAPAPLAIATEQRARRFGLGKTGPPSFNPLHR